MAASDYSAGHTESKRRAGRTVLSVVVLVGMLFGVSGVVWGGVAEGNDLYCNCDYGIDCAYGEYCRKNSGCEQPPDQEYAGKCVPVGK